MKSVIIFALIAMSQMVLALPAGNVEKAKEITIERANEILKKDPATRDKMLSTIADGVAKSANVGGLSENIKKALSQGDADFLVALSKAYNSKDEKAIKFIAEASAGVKTAKEAKALGQLSQMTYTGNFLAEVTKEVETGKTLTEAIKAASKTIGKTGKNEITIDKLLECIV
jgi:hypothetical protein